MLYSFDWKDKFMQERLALLLQMNFRFTYEEGTLDLQNTGLSSGEQEVLSFVQTLTNPVKFHILDKTLGSMILELHTKFWKWRFDNA